MGDVHRFAGTPQLIARPDRPWKRGLAWLALLGPFFFASYAFAHWTAGLRPHVDSVVFAWEHAIPFLAWTIVPYWSIDLLYALSLFLFATRRELDTHALRLLAAQLVAVGCFIAFPLRYAYQRPPVDGVEGWLFSLLERFDQPFNQAPSLHLALLVILWVAYARRVPAPWRTILHACFLLIGVSALTTWQHHFIDIPTGVWLGWFCVWLLPDRMPPPFARAALRRDPARRRLALRYAAGALGLAALALAGGGAWAWLMWAAASLMLVAAIYAYGNADALQKRADGSMSAAALWLLSPYVAGAWISARWWTRASAPADRVAPGLLIGRVPGLRRDPRRSFAAIVDVCAELPCRARAHAYASVPMLDLVPPSAEQIERACAAIESARAAGPVLVCCALGFSRSALVAAAYLLRSGAATDIDAAVAQVRHARAQAVFTAGQLAALAAWERLHAPAAKRGR